MRSSSIDQNIVNSCFILLFLLLSKIIVNFKVTGHYIHNGFKLSREDLSVTLRQLVRYELVHKWDALRSCSGNRSVLLLDAFESAIKGQKKASLAQQSWKNKLKGFSRLSKHCLNSAGIFTSEGNKLTCSRTGSKEVSIKLYQFTET